MSDNQADFRKSRVLNETQEVEIKTFALPELNEKRVLDVDSSDGRRCAYAVEQGAALVVGVDADDAALKKAAQSVPKATFLRGSASNLPQGVFDVVICPRSFFDVESQEELVERLKRVKSRLAPGGTLVAECGLLPGFKREPVFERVQSADGKETSYPSWALATRSFLSAGLAFRWISTSKTENGVDHLVFHCRPEKPVILFVLGNPGSGKSTFSSILTKDKPERLIHVDFETLELYEKEYGAVHYDCYNVNGVCSIVNDRKEDGINYIAEELRKRIEDVLSKTGVGPVIVEGVVPASPEYRAVYNALLSLLGDDFVVWQCERGALFEETRLP